MDAPPLDIDGIIQRLLDAEHSSPEEPPPLSNAEIKLLCAAARKVLLSQPTLLQLPAPVHVCGDIHGQYSDLLRIFRAAGPPSETNRYLFLGDYVDRGSRSVETTCLLLAYKVFCVHGGLSPELESMDQIRRVRCPLPLVPNEGLVCDLLWSDPDAADEWGWGESARGRYFAFGSDVVAEFVQKHGLRMVCRVHEMNQGGYEWFADGKLVTVFSTPNYAGRCDNAGAVMTVHGDLTCSFHILQPTPLAVLADAADEHA
uniref:Uncharacterized protein n=1 Tax=Avena sativa TaxID=4498 RepID=A0ACD6AKL7_AVESA